MVPGVNERGVCPEVRDGFSPPARAGRPREAGSGVRRDMLSASGAGGFMIWIMTAPQGALLLA